MNHLKYIFRTLSVLMLLGIFSACDTEDKPKPEPPKPSLEISKSETKLEVGAKEILTLKHGSGEYEITYSDDKVAKVTINQAEVTVEALSAGTAEVTIKDKKTDSSVKLTVTVNKKPEAPLPEGVVVKDGVLISWPASAIPSDGKVTLHSSITEIKTGAFKDTPLKELVMPATLKKVQPRAFEIVNDLKRVEIMGAEEMGEGAFYQCHGLEFVSLPGTLKVIGENTFAECDALKEVSLSEGIAEIAPNMFFNCTALSTLKLPGSITKIGKAAFLNCSELKSMEIPSGVKRVEDSLFKGCSVLESVTLPDQLTEIGREAFSNCVLLKEITIPATVTKIEYNAFNGCTKLKSISLPASLTELEDGAFQFCAGLTEVKFADNSKLKYIRNNTFKNCERLPSMVVPEGVEEIGKAAFMRCKSMTSISLPSTLKLLESNAFYDSKKLITFTILADEPPRNPNFGDPFNKTSPSKILKVKDPSKYEEWAKSNRFVKVEKL